MFRWSAAADDPVVSPGKVSMSGPYGVQPPACRRALVRQDRLQTDGASPGTCEWERMVEDVTQRE